MSRHRDTVQQRLIWRLALLVVLTGLLTTVIPPGSASARGSSGETVSNAPRNGDRPHVQIAVADAAAPEIEFPGMSAAQRAAARLDLRAYDKMVAAAMVDADQAHRASGASVPVPVDIELSQASGPDVGVVSPAPPLFHEPAAPGADSADLVNEAETISTASACVGNCYQTDSLALTDPGNQIYAVDYLVWLAIPQSNETNRCDDATHSSGCFWFYSTQNDMASEPYSNSAMHVGPRRGVSAAGSAGPNWKTIISGYESGSYVGGQSETLLPVATWIRVRVWRVATGTDSTAPYAPWSRWGVWGLWSGTDHYLGSLTIDGHWIKSVRPFMEVYEANGQCSTDLERGYFDNFRYWQPGTSNASFSQATAQYEANCSNTSWHALGGDFVRDERETTRIIGHGDPVW